MSNFTTERLEEVNNMTINEVMSTLEPVELHTLLHIMMIFHIGKHVKDKARGKVLVDFHNQVIAGVADMEVDVENVENSENEKES